jgi:predicted NBD/HSP70 family sugar kinase
MRCARGKLPNIVPKHRRVSGIEANRGSFPDTPTFSSLLNNPQIILFSQRYKIRPMLEVKTAALPASLRRTNQRTVISLLFRLGSASRADLAKAAGISQPTAGKITSELLQLGVLQEAGNGSPALADRLPRLGRPGQMLRLNGEQPRFVTLELGVSETCLSVLPVAVNLEDKWTCCFPTPKSPEAWVKELKKSTSEISNLDLWGVLVSVPGIVEEAAGSVLFSPNLHWLEKTNLAELISERWDLPVILVQEIRALALGHLTAEPGGEDFLLVDFGQGVGGAIVSQGKLFPQPKPLNGEVGHTPVPGNPRVCGCGAVGCLETLVSERGLLESFAGARGTLNSHPATWETLRSHVREQGLETWLTGALDAAAKVIAGALNVLGIHRVIITGLLTELPGAVDHLAAGIGQGALWGRFGTVVCQSAPHRRAAGLVAAGLDRLVLPADRESGVSLPSRKPRQPK